MFRTWTTASNPCLGSRTISTVWADMAGGPGESLRRSAAQVDRVQREGLTSRGEKAGAGLAIRRGAVPSPGHPARSLSPLLHPLEGPTWLDGLYSR